MMAASMAAAAEIKVFTTLNIRPALDELRPQFEQATGNKVNFVSQGAAATMARMEAGETADAIIHARATLEKLAARGMVRTADIVDLAHSSIGVVVRAGAPKPDIATDEALKRALLAAPSVAYPDPAQGSLGGNYLAVLFQHWGIAEQLKPKLRLAAGGAPAAEMVAKGEAAIGLNQISEFMRVQGIAFVEPLPPSLVRKVVMAGAVLPGAKEPGAAKAWIDFLASLAAAGALKAHGMEP
jgi:molybdate transport system substrate-binding protein